MVLKFTGRWGVLLLGGALLVANCGPDDETTANDETVADSGIMADSGTMADDAGTGGLPQVPATGPLSTDLMPTAVAQALCAKIENCGCGWVENDLCHYDAICPASLEECIDEVTDLYTRTVESGLAQPLLEYDPVRARACVSYIEDADCGDVAHTNTCAAVWQGTVPIGGACDFSRQCEGYDDNEANCDVQCTPPEAHTTEPGAACNSSCRFDEALDYMSCVTVAGGAGSGSATCYENDGYRCFEGSCVPLGEIGDPCSGKFQCADDAACYEEVCSARIPLGAACRAGIDDNPCVAGAYCSGLECIPQQQLSESCIGQTECVTGFCLYELCSVPSASPLCVPEDY